MPYLITLPWNKLKDFQRELAGVKDGHIEAVVRFVQKDGPPDQYIQVGGVWSLFDQKYTDEPIKDQPKEVVLHRVQWEFLNHIKDGLLYSVGAKSMDIPIQDVIFHGGRRSGKSVGLAAAALMWALVRPASMIWIVSLMKRHGERIMRLIKKWLPMDTWEYDARNKQLTLFNFTTIRAVNEQYYNTERGDSIDLLLLDEAAFFSEKVYNALAPSVYDRNGLVAIASSPNGFNWFYDRAMLAQSEDPEVRASVRVVGMSLLDNPFLSEAAIKHAENAAKTLGVDAYKQEILGEFKSPIPLAFDGFSDNIHIRKASEDHTERKEMMREIGEKIFNVDDLQYFVGVDFNFDPTAGAIIQFDKQGRMWVVEEHISSQGTEPWAVTLEHKLKAMGVKNPKRSTILIADASGQWQGEGRNAPPKRATWRILRSMGWTVFAPSVGKTNPLREDRFEVIRALLLNARGEPRFFVDPGCEEVLDMVKKLPTHNGIPRKHHKYSHIYDAVTYVAYRIWGTSAGRELWGHDLVFQPIEDFD